ncbi:MAG TPA: alkaline phosphatase family protein [Kofleriaceae bacterium]
MTALAGLKAIGCGVTDELEDGGELNWGDDKSDGATCRPAAQSWAQARARISSVVVLCMENRSFDHYFGALSLPRDRGGLGVTGINGLKGGETNRTTGGSTIQSRVLDDFTPHDLPHEWGEMHAMFDGGRMGGFVRAAEAAARTRTAELQKNKDASLRVGPDELASIMAREAMGYHTPAQLPMLYALARQSTLCEHWYSSVMGPTWPNRFFLHGGDSRGVQSNTPITSINWESILDVVHKSGKESKNFYHDVAWLRGASPSPTREARDIFEDMVSSFDALTPTGFFARARENKLPALSIIDPHFGLFNPQDANDDHPDFGGGEGHHVRMGQALIASIVAALAQNRDQWNRTLFVITYDEGGGFYDHAKPPTTYDARADFRQLGFRVPALVIGPYARRGCSVKTTLDHTSLLSSIIRLLDTQGYENAEVNKRLNAGNDLLECLDANALEGQPHAPPALPAVQLSTRAWKNRPMVSRHHDLYTVARSMSGEQQRKAASPAILENVLAESERLGAVKMIR